MMQLLLLVSSIEFDGYTYSVVEMATNAGLRRTIRGDVIPAGLTQGGWACPGATAVYGEGKHWTVLRSMRDFLADCTTGMR